MESFTCRKFLSRSKAIQHETPDCHLTLWRPGGQDSGSSSDLPAAQCRNPVFLTPTSPSSLYCSRRTLHRAHQVIIQQRPLSNTCFQRNSQPKCKPLHRSESNPNTSLFSVTWVRTGCEQDHASQEELVMFLTIFVAVCDAPMCPLPGGSMKDKHLLPEHSHLHTWCF